MIAQILLPAMTDDEPMAIVWWDLPAGAFQCPPRMSSLSVRELKGMLKTLGLSDQGCISKEDLVQQFKRHPCVVMDANDEEAKAGEDLAA